MKRKYIDIDEIKKISIKWYMEFIGCKIKEDKGYYGKYLAPYREDVRPSLKVDYNRNVWVDYGTGEGGTIIDIVMKVQNISLGEAIQYLTNLQIDETSFSFHRKIVSAGEEKNKIIIKSVSPISNNKLIQFLNFRKIPLNIARLYCKEVHFEIAGNENMKKEYYSIGFPNDSRGYAMRNWKYLQCTESDITTFEFSENNNNRCFVFEGFFDFLSYLVMQDIKKIKTNSVILNSVVNLNKALPFLEKHDSVITYLDNDEAGRNATTIIQQKCKYVEDKSSFYSDFNDLNDYLKSGKKIRGLF